MIERRLMVWCWSGIAGLAAILAVVAWVAWPVTVEETPRAREFRDYDICLLAGETGISVAPASTAWAGLQEVSKQTDVRVSYLQVTGEQTPARAEQYVATQVQQRCGVIVAIGQNQVAAVDASKTKFPEVQFVTLSDTATAAEVVERISPLVPKP